MGYNKLTPEEEKFNEDQYPKEWLTDDYVRKGWKLTNGVEKFERGDISK